MMVTRPQTVGYALADSPSGQAAWMYDKISQWTYSGGVPERSIPRDEILDDISLYWLTNTATSAAQIYWEDHSNNFNAVDISLPAAITVFPGEIYQAPRSWAERSYHNLIYFNEVDKGGHFAAWEEPALFAREVRAGFRPLRRVSGKEWRTRAGAVMRPAFVSALRFSTATRMATSAACDSVCHADRQ